MERPGSPSASSVHRPLTLRNTKEDVRDIKPSKATLTEVLADLEEQVAESVPGSDDPLEPVRSFGMRLYEINAVPGIYSPELEEELGSIIDSLDPDIEFSFNQIDGAVNEGFLEAKKQGQ
jgi:hypothetical protein